MEREDFFVRKRLNPSENKEKEIFSRRQGSVNNKIYFLSFYRKMQININEFLLSIGKCKYI